MKQATIIRCVMTTAVAISPVTALGQDVGGNADTTFKANSNVIQPVDPGDDKEIIPVYPPTAGPLSINYASSISFGKQTITNNDRIFHADMDLFTQKETGETRQSPNFVQVTDLRGTGTGWVLSVRQNGPLLNEKGTSLAGATLSVSAVSVKAQHGQEELVMESVVKDLAEDGSKQTILTTTAGKGMGTWNVYLGSESDVTQGVKLVVPKNQPKEGGKYFTTLTWLLEDVL
ncbi:WxL domain-containing protein [Vagococcus sp. BWB3-3]|uniref:WxL domain-containing protein n=1 Tax=Vagococcus allomyrinae TaxID=2794353 RepID=A0A940SQ75_9ENTE|nr:WxL domain-containing protein [Vagococcus allomyrinae]MBP1039417.1 WxL domain-containing protein [Vagococcus allomyrinae]